MTITICGSITFMEYMIETQNKLLSLGCNKVHIPEKLNVELPKTGIASEDGKDKIVHNLIQTHYEKILQSDAVLILNYEKNGIKNYIGGNTLMEMGFAFVNHKKIFLLNPIPELSYSAEIVAMQPIIINGDLSKIQL